MTYYLSDQDLTTPPGPLDSDEDISNIADQFTRNREFEKRYRHPAVEVIYSFEDVPRKNIDNYYFQLLEAAMERRCPKIVVEPSSMGIRLGQYINIGYYMHWCCIATGVISIFFGITFRHKTYVIYSCALLSCLLLHASNLYYSNLKLAHYHVSSTPSLANILLVVFIKAIHYHQYADQTEIREKLRATNPEVKLLSDFPTVLTPYNPIKRRLWHHAIGMSAGVMMASLMIKGLPDLLCRCPDGVIPDIIRYEGNLFEFFCLVPFSILSSFTTVPFGIQTLPPYLPSY